MRGSIAGQATLLAATVATGHWYQSGSYRYDLVLEVRPDDGGEPFRAQLDNVHIYQAKPRPGIEIKVKIHPATRKVTLLWRGDPNLDMDAWRKSRRSRYRQTLLAAFGDRGYDEAIPPIEPAT